MAGMAHSTLVCWRKKFLNPKNNEDSDQSSWDESDETDSDDLITFSPSHSEDSEDESVDNRNPQSESSTSSSVQQDSTSDASTLPKPAADIEEAEESEEDLEEGDVFDIRESVLHHPPSCRDTNHFNYDGPPEVQQPVNLPKDRLLGVQMPGRAIDERRPPVFARPRDIPGRLLTEGDIIRYFTGYLDERQNQIWLTARVEKMFLTQQRKYPEHYNVRNERGESLSLKLVPGGNFEVRKDDRWERFT